MAYKAVGNEIQKKDERRKKENLDFNQENFERLLALGEIIDEITTEEIKNAALLDKRITDHMERKKLVHGQKGVPPLPEDWLDSPPATPTVVGPNGFGNDVATEGGGSPNSVSVSASSVKSTLTEFEASISVAPFPRKKRETRRIAKERNRAPPNLIHQAVLAPCGCKGAYERRLAIVKREDGKIQPVFVYRPICNCKKTPPQQNLHDSELERQNVVILFLFCCD